MIVIAGLGNPGIQYKRTRHNIGFMAVDEFIAEHCEPARRSKKPEYTLVKTMCGTTPVAVVKPMMYMNLSGRALSLAPFNFRGSDTLLVVFDDASLEIGKLRFRAKGSSGGHKGMQNIIEVFGGNEIHRLRIGIGKDQDMPLTDFVLRTFTPQEKKLLPETISTAAEAIRFYIENGIAAAMNRFNTSNAPDGEKA